jgi:conjugative relaxase-like TrwC/TraI family protein
MFSVHQAASIFYYMGHEENSNHEPLFIPAGEEANSNYYSSKRQGDPLASPSIWTGELARAVGLLPGSTVKQENLTAMWFGQHPKLINTPLDKRGLSYADQMAAQKNVAQAEIALFAARRSMGEIRASYANSKMDRKVVNKQDDVVEQQKRIDKAKHALELAQKSKNYRTQAHDLTFSAPKSVSILWAAMKTKAHFENDADAGGKADRIQAIVMESAKRVIDQIIEKECIFTRQRTGNSGKRKYETTKGLAVALIQHFESRPTVQEAFDGKKEWNVPDPQLHVHALMMAMGLDYDNNVAAIWTRYMADNAKSLGAAFRAEMSAMLRVEGYNLRESATDTVNSFEIAGISDKQISSFSQRRAIVTAAMAKGSSGQQAVLAERNVKRDYSSEEMLADWQMRLALQEVDTRAIELAKAPRPAYMRHKPDDMVSDAVKELLEMTGEIALRDIHRKAFERAQHATVEGLGGLTAIAWAKKFATSIIVHKDMQVGSRLDKYGRPTLTSKGLIEREKALYYEHLTAMKNPSRADQVTNELADAAIAKAEIFLAKKKNIADFQFADFQKTLVRSMVCSKASINIALAPAGCGKTTAALAACMAFEENKDCRFFALAPSNKAAQQLARDLHKDESVGRTPQKMLASIKSGRETLTKSDVLFVDEASMLDFDTAEGLVKAALAAKGGPARIVLMGDTEQLPSVGRGNFLRRLVEGNEQAVRNNAEQLIATRILETEADWAKISRQKSEAGKMATAFMALGQNAKALEIFQGLGAVHLSSAKEDAIEELIDDAFASIATQTSELQLAKGKDRNAFQRKVQESLQSMAILASTRADVATLNTLARGKLAKVGYLDPAKRPSATLSRGKVGTLLVCEGERIIFCNAISATTATKDGDRPLNIPKSSCATVLHVEKTDTGARLVVALDSGDKAKLATIEMDSFSDIDYAYAMTVHKSQGSTVNRSYELFSSFAARELDYVAKSRYREQHHVYGAEHEFKSYQASVSHLTEKIEASDVGFSDLSVFAPTREKLNELERASAEIDSKLIDLAHQQVSLRQRHIAQGRLVDFGEAERDKHGRARHYATIEVLGRTMSYEGVNLLHAFESAGVKIGDHIGLEAISPERGIDISGVKWKFYSEDKLAQVGLLRTEESVPAMVAESLKGQATKEDSANTFHATTAALTNEEDKHSILASQIRDLLLTTAAHAKELSSAELHYLNYIDLPETATDAVFAWLKHSKPGMREKISQALTTGFDNNTALAIEESVNRKWLALEGDVAYSINANSRVEAWAMSNLPAAARQEINSSCQSLSEIRTRHETTLSDSRKIANVISESFGSLAEQLSVSIVERDDFGICLAIGAKDVSSINRSAFLSAAFPAIGSTRASKPSAMKNLAKHKGFDADHSAFIFPIQDEMTGALAGYESAVAKELIEYATEMLWTHIHSKKDAQQETQTQAESPASATKSAEALRLARLWQGLNAPSNTRLIDEAPLEIRRLDAIIVEVGPHGVLLRAGKDTWIADRISLASAFGPTTPLDVGTTLPIHLGRTRSGIRKISNGLAPQAGESQ